MDMIDIEEENRIEENNRAILRGAKENEIRALPVKIVAGNKCDLKDSRVVSSRTGLEWARKRRCGFMETSAREMVNVEETFACKAALCPTNTQSPRRKKEREMLTPFV
jgi:GTPase KRas protein